VRVRLVEGLAELKLGRGSPDGRVGTVEHRGRGVVEVVMAGTLDEGSQRGSERRSQGMSDMPEGARLRGHYTLGFNIESCDGVGFRRACRRVPLALQRQLL
jgi:hypothetical protein